MNKEEMDIKGILFIAQRYKLWDFKSEGDYSVFYDQLQKRIIFLQSANVYAFQCYDKNKDPNPIYFLLPSKYKDPKALSISNNDCYIAIQSDTNRIAFIDFGSLTTNKQSQVATKESEIKFAANKGSILSFSFMKSLYFDLVICFTSGVDIYKYDTSTRNLGNPIKNIPHNVRNTWINPLEGFILLSSLKRKGEIQIYCLHKDEVKLKNIKGPSFNLALRKAADETKAEKDQRDTKALQYYLEIPQLLTQNIKQHVKRLMEMSKKKAEGYQIHELLLTKLYLRNFFIHYNMAQGTIQSYKLSFDKFNKTPSLIILDSSCEYSLQISDNLLIVLNFYNNAVFAYDIKGENKLRGQLCQDLGTDLRYVDSYICDNIDNAQLLNYSEQKKHQDYVVMEVDVNVKSEGGEEIEDVVIETIYNFMNDMSTARTEEIKKELEVDNREKEVREIDLRNLIYVDSSLAYHHEEDKFFSYLLNKRNYLRTEKNKVQGVVTIMRRHKSRGVALNGIKELMEHLLPLSKLSKLFSKLNTIIKTAQMKGVFREIQSKPREVRRITKPMPQVKQTYYLFGNTTPVIYPSRLEGTNPTFIVFLLVTL